MKITKTKPSLFGRNGAAEQRKVSKESNENSRETDVKVFMIIIYHPGRGGGVPEDFVFV